MHTHTHTHTATKPPSFSNQKLLSAPRERGGKKKLQKHHPLLDERSSELECGRCKPALWHMHTPAERRTKQNYENSCMGVCARARVCVCMCVRVSETTPSAAPCPADHFG